MIFRQITHDDLGCASYLIGDEDAGGTAVVDPKLGIDEYLALARYMGVRIEHILETHNHADHVSGHGRLAAATGARIHVHRLAEPDYAHEPFDTARGPEPWAVLTGDTLSSATSRDRTWPSTSRRARTASSARFTSSCSRCPASARSGPAHGAAQVLHVADGGVGTWQQHGWPIEEPEGSTVQ
jgi:L-ascorbate metabolism protein UlaG (beta-lactamase superfamily)